MKLGVSGSVGILYAPFTMFGDAGVLSVLLVIIWLLYPFALQTVIHPSDAIGFQEWMQGLPISRYITEQAKMWGLITAVLALAFLCLLHFLTLLLIYRRIQYAVSLWLVATLLIGGIANGIWYLNTGHFDLMGHWRVFRRWCSSSAARWCSNISAITSCSAPNGRRRCSMSGSLPPGGGIFTILGMLIGDLHGYAVTSRQRKAELKAQRQQQKAARAAERASLARQQRWLEEVQREQSRGSARDATEAEALEALRGRGGRHSDLDNRRF